MYLRLLGTVVSLGLVGYLLVATLGSNSKVDKAIDKNPTVVEQKKALQSAGVNVDDKKQLHAYVDQQAKQLEEYEHSADGLTGQ